MYLQVLLDVTGEEFVSFMKILALCPSMQTLQGRQSLVDVAVDQAALDEEFIPSDPDCVERLVACVRQAMPLFSKNVHSTKFVGFMCDHVVAHHKDITAVQPEEEHGEAKPADNAEAQLDVLKLLAEMSMYSGPQEGVEGKISKLYDQLLVSSGIPSSRLLIICSALKGN